MNTIAHPAPQDTPQPQPQPGQVAGQDDVFGRPTLTGSRHEENNGMNTHAKNAPPHGQPQSAQVVTPVLDVVPDDRFGRPSLTGSKREENNG